MATKTKGFALLACAALLGGAARAEARSKDERAGTEPASDVMGGQGRGSGSGKPSTEKDLGSQSAKTAEQQAMLAEEAAGTRPAYNPTIDRVPFDPKLARAGGLREPPER